MKELLQAVDIKKWGSKIISSALIVSILMIDVAKAMPGEDDPLLVHNPLSLKLPPTDHEVTIEIIDDFSPRQNSSLDDADSSTGSISTSPEKSTPEGDKSVAVILLPGLSSAFSQSNDLSPPQLEAIKSQPSSPPVHSSPTCESSGDFNPFAVGAFELHKFGIDHRTTITVDENPQLQLSSSTGNDIASSIGSSLMRGGSLQDRSPPRPPSKSAPDSSSNNGKPATVVPDLILSSANHDPLGSDASGSETYSAEDIGFSFLGTQPNIPRTPNMQIKGSKRNLFSAPAAVFSRQPFTSESSKLLDPTLSLKYSSIQGDDRRDDPSPSSNPLGDPEARDLPAIEDDSKCYSCCTNRPLWPQPTEYTLPNALDKIQRHSEFFLAPVPNHRTESVSSSHDSSDSFSFEESDSSSPNGSPSKDLGAGGVLLPSDEDDPDVTFDNPTHSAAYPATADYKSLSNLRSPFGIPVDASLLPTHHFLLPAHDLESGEFPPSMSAKTAFKQLLDNLKKLPAKALSQLKSFVHQVLNGKSTWSQRLGKWVIGPLIGLGFAYMMAPVYDGGITYLNTQGEIFEDFINSNFLEGCLLYIMFSAVPDGIARNSHLWKKGIAYLAQEGKEIGRMCVAGGISFLTAVIPPVYLITAEEYPIKSMGLHGLDNVYIRTMLVGIPFLYLDAFASDFNIAWTALPEIKKWLGKLWSRQSLHAQLPVLQEDSREKFNKNLEYLEHFLYQAPKAIIKEIYDNIAQVREGAQVPCCENYDEALASQQAYAVLCYLLSFSDKIIKGASKPKSIYDISADVFNYLCLLAGTPARGIALQFIGATVFGLVFSDPIAQILGGIYMICALLPQTGLEYKGMDNFFKRFIVEEDPHGHGANPVYRGLTKLYCAFQGLIYTFPLAVLTLQAFQQWFGEGWWPLAVGIPFFIPEFAAQTYSFNGTYNQLVATSITNVHNTKTRKCFGKKPNSDWKRDWLIRFVQESRVELKYLHPDMIANLSKGIEVFQKAE
jgi:hypothetical protein